MGKFYTFTAGQLVPSWMFKADYHGMARGDALHNLHHGKIVFMRSCVVLRGNASTHSKVMPVDNRFGPDGIILIQGFRNATLGGVRGATGVCIGPEGMGVAGLSATRG